MLTPEGDSGLGGEETSVFLLVKMQPIVTVSTPDISESVKK
jgi:hypothetical protein